MEKKYEEIKGAFGIILKDDSILLDLRTSKDARVWETPGGGVEPGESAEEAIKRELKEEINIDVKKVRLIGLANYSVYTLKTEVVAFFLIEDFSGEPVTADEVEKLVRDVRWMKISELPSLLNISWRVIDAIYFLSSKYKKYKNLYQKLESLYDDRLVYSSRYPFYSSEISDLERRNRLKSKTMPTEEEKLISDITEHIESPILEINAGDGIITNILLKKFDHIDVLEVNPDFRRQLKDNFKEKISFIEGVVEQFESKNKYNTILVFEPFLQLKSFIRFLFSVYTSLNQGGKLIFLLDENKTDLRIFAEKAHKTSPMSKLDQYNVPNLRTLKGLLSDFDFDIHEVIEIKSKLYLPSRLGDIVIPFKSGQDKSKLFIIIAEKR